MAAPVLLGENDLFRHFNATIPILRDNDFAFKLTDDDAEEPTNANGTWCVCGAAYKEGERLVTHKVCGNTLHRNCASRWTHENANGGSCAICRQPVDETKLEVTSTPMTEEQRATMARETQEAIDDEIIRRFGPPPPPEAPTTAADRKQMDESLWREKIKQEACGTKRYEEIEYHVSDEFKYHPHPPNGHNLVDCTATATVGQTLLLRAKIADAPKRFPALRFFYFCVREEQTISVVTNKWQEIVWGANRQDDYNDSSMVRFDGKKLDKHLSFDQAGLKDGDTIVLDKK